MQRKYLQIADLIWLTFIFFFNSQNSIIRKQQPNSKHRQNICCGWIWNAAHRLTVNVDSPAGGVIHGGQGGMGRGMLTQSWFPEHCLCSRVPWRWTPSPCASPSMHSQHSGLKRTKPGAKINFSSLEICFSWQLFWSNWLKKITTIIIK